MIPLLVAAAVASAPIPPMPSDPSPYFLDDSTVVQIECREGSGTAFYVGGGKYITARHVALETDKKGWPSGRCKIAGKPVRILQIGYNEVDYALVSAPVYLPYHVITSCEPFLEGEQYYATGFAMGRPWPVTQRLIGTGAKSTFPGAGFKAAFLKGSTTEGQSGGPVRDRDGVVHGFVSAGPNGGESESDIFQLADTPYCKGRGKA